MQASCYQVEEVERVRTQRQAEREWDEEGGSTSRAKTRGGAAASQLPRPRRPACCGCGAPCPMPPPRRGVRVASVRRNSGSARAAPPAHRRGKERRRARARHPAERRGWCLGPSPNTCARRARRSASFAVSKGSLRFRKSHASLHLDVASLRRATCETGVWAMLLRLLAALPRRARLAVSALSRPHRRSTQTRLSSDLFGLSINVQVLVEAA